MYKLIWILLVTTNAFAFDIKKPITLDIGLGTWLENYGQTQATRDGETNGFEFNPYLSLATQYNLYKGSILIPEAGYIFQRTSESISRNQFFLRADIAYPLNKYLRVRVGSSFMVLMTSGEGGEDTLDNGDSTETYYIPEERKTAYNQTLDLALEALVDKMSYKLQGYIYSFNEEDDRMYSLSLSINYMIPFREIVK